MIGIFKRRVVLMACAAVMTISAFSCGAEQSSSRRRRTAFDATEPSSQESTTTAAKRTRPRIAANQEYSTSPYYDRLRWVYYGEGEGQTTSKDVDLFLIAPTVYDGENLIMDIFNAENREKFHASIDARKGIFEEKTRIFAPYYGQISTKGYEYIGKDREALSQIAYADVAEAFRYYLMYENNGRPIIIAGFSQGADMCYRLMKDYSDDEKFRSQLVAAYAIGFGFSDDAVKNYPNLHFAKSDKDTGVIISFECEAPELNESLLCPAGSKIVSINPLTWTTDNTPAKKKLNKGACFMKKDGSEVEKEIPGLCGCYIDPERGTLKVTDINKDQYPPALELFPEGSYNMYDYELFYRNLQENVGVRIDAYYAAKANPEQSAEPETTQPETTAKK